MCLLRAAVSRPGGSCATLWTTGQMQCRNHEKVVAFPSSIELAARQIVKCKDMDCLQIRHLVTLFSPIVKSDCTVPSHAVLAPYLGIKKGLKREVEESRKGILDIGARNAGG